jgi:hypothetical protein
VANVSDELKYGRSKLEVFENSQSFSGKFTFNYVMYVKPLDIETQGEGILIEFLFRSRKKVSHQQKSLDRFLEEIC